MAPRSRGANTSATRSTTPPRPRSRRANVASLVLHRLDRARLVGVGQLALLVLALLQRDSADTTLEQRANRLHITARAQQFLLTGAPPVQVADCRGVLAALMKIVCLRADLLTVRVAADDDAQRTDRQAILADLDFLDPQRVLTRLEQDDRLRCKSLLLLLVHGGLLTRWAPDRAMPARADSLSGEPRDGCRCGGRRHRRAGM